MNRSDYRFLNRSRLAALVLVTGSVLGLLVACGDDENPGPSGPPPITTGGGGGTGEAGEDSGGATTTAGSGNRSGSANGGASAHGGSGTVEEGGAAGLGGEGGEAGAGGPLNPDCPTTDKGFLNAPSPGNVLTSEFNNARVGGTTLQPLP